MGKQVGGGTLYSVVAVGLMGEHKPALTFRPENVLYPFVTQDMATYNMKILTTKLISA